jgi:hypothetical protein
VERNTIMRMSCLERMGRGAQAFNYVCSPDWVVMMGVVRAESSSRCFQFLVANRHQPLIAAIQVEFPGP